VIEMYAITDHPAPPLPTIAPLREIAARGLAAVCAPAAEREDATPDALWRHEGVVEALMADRDLLPVRFGTRLRDDATAARALAERHAELVAALARVRGAVELSLRVAAAGGGSSGTMLSQRAPDGTAHLRARAHADRARERVLAQVHEPLAARARAAVQHPARGPYELLRAAYLVDRRAVDGCTRLVARLQDADPTVRLLCTGPWPPYSFAK
jgi:hypothetical protein